MAGKRRSGGRASRVALRASGPAIDPAPNGPKGGQYRPLLDAEILNILDTSYRILAEIGMGDVPASLVSAAEDAGIPLGPDGRMRFSRGFVEDIIAGACRSFMLYGRDPAYDIEIGGDAVLFGTGGAAVQTLDLETGRYRPSSLRDLYDFARLADRLDTLSWFTRCCIATDIADPFDLDINTVYALLKGTAKPVGTSFTLCQYVDPIIDLFDVALGGEGKFAARPFCKAHISPVISPLKYGEDAVEVARACVRRRVPINSIIGAQSGATGPAAPAGMLAASTAEALAQLVMVNLFERGYPMIFSNWPFVIDLRTGAFAGSGAEISMMNAAVAQIGNALGLPTGVASSMADAKAVDAQMGIEKAMSAATVGLSGANMIYESAGMMGSLLGASFEAFVVDDQILKQANRLIRGIEVTDETLGFEAVKNTVFGDGHFLGSDHTMAAMERDYLYPDLFDRAAPDVWEEEGARDLATVARERVRAILDTHHPDYLAGDADAKIRSNYNILLNTS